MYKKQVFLGPTWTRKTFKTAYIDYICLEKSLKYLFWLVFWLYMDWFSEWKSREFPKKKIK